MAVLSKKYRTSIVFNLLLMLVLCVVLYMVLFSSLSGITNHGKQMTIPVIIGKNVNDALNYLDKEGFDVYVDSSYDIKRKPGEVLSQMPDTGSLVKRGRTIFITVNKKQAPLTPMPALEGLSYRSAEMVLRSNKLLLGDTTHRPDIADGAILEQLFNNTQIAAGNMIPQGSKIDLVVGDGLGNFEFDVPSVTGMEYEEGIAVLNASGLQFIAVWEPVITDSASAIIYKQTPTAHNELGAQNMIKEGDIIYVRVRQTAPIEEEKPSTKKSGNNNSGNNDVNGNTEYEF